MAKKYTIQAEYFVFLLKGNILFLMFLYSKKERSEVVTPGVFTKIILAAIG